eukprot:TRINITY_DN1609_c0_g1_i1.p1 TRINITY_DN1609_c0_g1~~TRINITY_DN1609_c0_g1_i1.p1  ORF type:complete len:427 (+),score=92.58 TRINITY_DN1609_c0_g1_i1:43-1323(+)
MGEFVITIEFVQAKNLAPMDSNGLSDPYCVVKSTFNKQQFKTKVVKKTLNPDWNEKFKFFAPKLDGALQVKLWDKDKFTADDFLGEVSIPINSLQPGKEQDLWLELKDEPKEVQKKEKGQLHVKLSYSASSGPVHPESSKLEDNYTIGRQLGKGGFSIVKEGTNKATGAKVAIKLIEKGAFKESDLGLVRREIAIMKRLSHPHVVQLYDVYDSAEYLSIVLELVTGGELFDHIVTRGHISEAEASKLIKQLLEALSYLHDNGIAHRDLKPENLLIGGQNKDLLKVTDFGLSNEFDDSKKLTTRCGTPYYVAPEVVLGQQYDSAVDMWATGVITYIVLCGYPPFFGKSDNVVFEKILSCKYTYPPKEWDRISAAGKDFINKLLVVNAADRMTAADALYHPWISSDEDEAPKLTRIDTDKLKELIKPK